MIRASLSKLRPSPGNRTPAHQKQSFSHFDHNQGRISETCFHIKLKFLIKKFLAYYLLMFIYWVLLVIHVIVKDFLDSFQAKIPLFLYSTLQRTNTQNWKQIFPEKELRGYSHSFHIHVSVIWEICCRKYAD